jgi:hypothetical protein
MRAHRLHSRATSSTVDLINLYTNTEYVMDINIGGQVFMVQIGMQSCVRSLFPLDRSISLTNGRSLEQKRSVGGDSSILSVYRYRTNCQYFVYW